MKKTFALLMLLGMAATAQATSLVYTPVNPDFGGNPANGTVLLNEANAQNATHAPVKAATAGATTSNELTSFTNALQSAILNKLTTAVENEIVGPTGKLTPGVLNTSNFTITVTDSGAGGFVIQTYDKNNGQTSTFDISNTAAPTGTN